MRPSVSTLIVMIMLFACQAHAQNLIAVTNETSSSFYETLDLAITNAKDGDAIYLPGRSFSISVPINKQLQIIGVGHHPDSCRATGITQITGNVTVTNGSNRGSLMGCKITGQISFNPAAGQSIDYYSIERCNIQGVQLTSQCTNVIINESVINSIINGGGIQGLKVSKCIISGKSNYIKGLKSNCLITNNDFINGASYSNDYGWLCFFIDVSGCYFRNNIFLYKVYDGGFIWNEGVFCNNNTFVNNYLPDLTGFSSTNSFTNSIIGPVDDLFVRKTKDLFDYDQDYHILNTSPAHNAGTDGTDLGIYGTASPWKDGSLPSNPHIQSKIISNTGGNLNVKIKVAAQDY